MTNNTHTRRDAMHAAFGSVFANIRKEPEMTTNVHQLPPTPTEETKRKHLTPIQSTILAGWLAGEYDALLGKTYDEVAARFNSEVVPHNLAFNAGIGLTLVTKHQVLLRCEPMGLNTLQYKIVVRDPTKRPGKKPVALAEEVADQDDDDFVRMYRALDGKLFESKGERNAYDQSIGLSNELCRALDDAGHLFDSEQMVTLSAYLLNKYNLAPKVQS